MVTLVIIGVIAAITVPTVIQNTQKQEFVSGLKKSYAVLSQATNMIIAENGSPKKSDENDITWANTSDDLFNMYKKHLNNAKECGQAGGCWSYAARGELKKLDGRTDDNWDKSSVRNLILADGTYVMMWTVNLTACNPCAWMHVDVNGDKKPNTIGRDVFSFLLRENGLLPSSANDCNTTTGRGLGCTAKVLREGEMNY